MGEQPRSERESVSVSSTDPNALIALADTYYGLLQNDVVLVRGEPVVEKIETSRGLAQKIQEGIGGIASAETVNATTLGLDESERNVLESARRL